MIEFSITLTARSREHHDERIVLKIDTHISNHLEPLCKTMGLNMHGRFSEHYKVDAYDYPPQQQASYHISGRVKNHNYLYCVVLLFEALAKLFSQLPEVETCYVEWSC